MSTGTEPASRIRDLLVITLMALALLLPAIHLRPPSRQQELRVLISARNMVESGDWLHPEFQNQPRYRKPPMPYWLTATAMLPDRLTDSPARARLPFLLIALSTLYTLYALTGQKTSALLLLVSFGFWRFAPFAETDLVNTFGICLAMLGFQKNRGELTAAGMIFSILSKGPAGLFIPLITFLLLLPRQKQSLSWWLLAFIPPLLAGGAWLAFLLKDPVASEALRAEFTDTFLKSPHRKNIFFYVYTLPAMLGPAFIICLPRFRPHIKHTLPWVWLFVTFILLTLTTSKQNHYVIMLLPPAVWILAAFAPRKSFIPLVCFLIILGIGGDIWRNQTHEDALHSRFLRDIRPRVEQAPVLHVVGINSARFDYHLGRNVHNLDSARLAFRHARTGDAVIIIQPRVTYDSIEVLSPHDASDQTWIRRLVLRP